MPKAKPASISELYVAALRVHLEGSTLLSIESARDLGRQAAAQGIETAGVAKIHEAALSALILADRAEAKRNDMLTRAEIFFTEAMTPMQETPHGALEEKAGLEKMRETLDLADSNSELQLQISSRRSTRVALKSSEESSGQLLDESRGLEVRLEEIARRILSANEEERKRMSHQLQDEIAQTLLGIHVRLLALKKEAAASNAGIIKQIATTQGLVQQSVKTIDRLVREFGTQHESPAG